MNDGEHEALIENGCRVATFAISWRGPDALTLVLQSPDGRVIADDTSAPDVRHAYRGLRGRLIQVTRPQPGVWTYRVGPAGSWRGFLFSKTLQKAVRYRHFVFAKTPSIQFTLTSERLRYEPGEAIQLVGQIAAGPIVTGLPVTGVVVGPSRKSSKLKLVDDGNPRHGSQIADSGRYSTLIHPADPGVYTFTFVADNSEGLARPATVGEHAPTPPEDALPAIPPFVRQTSLAVLVGKPEVRRGQFEPGTVKRGYEGRLRLRLEHIPWVPGVSKLYLGPDIEVQELPSETIREGHPVFGVVVDRGAKPGFRDPVVALGRARHRLEGALRVQGDRGERPNVDPDRPRRPRKSFLGRRKKKTTDCD